MIHSHIAIAGGVGLREEDPMWSVCVNGGEGLSWSDADVEVARRLRHQIHDKPCGWLLNTLLGSPGRLWTARELIGTHPGIFKSARSVTGSLGGFAKVCLEHRKASPISRWNHANGDELETMYAVRPSTAVIFTVIP